MISRLRDVEAGAGGREAAAPPRAALATDGIDAWLGVLTGMLHMPEARRHAIRDELSEHLHQRCRELVLAGAPPADAVRQAVGELGETAELARRLDRAHRSRQRRIIMNVSILGLGAAVVSAAVFTMAPGDSIAPPSVFADTDAQRTPPAAVAGERVTVTAEMTLEELLSVVAAAHDVRIMVDWNALEQAGYAPDDAVGFRADSLPVPRVLEALARLDAVDPIDWRYSEDGLEINMREAFDQREVKLATYDLRDLLASVSEDEIETLLTKFVSPVYWEENGGYLARYEFVGACLFIEAPPRMHARAQWIFGQLAAGEDVGAALDAWGAPVSAAGALAPGDVLTFEVYELIAAGEWYRATRRIEADGTVRLPYVGELQAAGLHPRDVESAMTARVSELIQNPIVTVYTAVDAPLGTGAAHAGARRTGGAGAAGFGAGGGPGGGTGGGGGGAGGGTGGGGAGGGGGR